MITNMIYLPEKSGMFEVLYYPTGKGGPVRDYLENFEPTRPKALVRLRVDLEALAAEGMGTTQVLIRSLGRGLWELKRPYAGIQYRIFFCIKGRQIWLLHAIEKKSAKTPRPDFLLAAKRLKEVMR